MTQIVGIVCKESVNYSHRDAIIIACESQYTIGDSKVTNAQKMSIIRFSNRKQAMVVQAGCVVLSERAAHYMAEMAKERPLDDEFSVAKIAEEAVKKVRADIISSMHPREYSIAEQDEFFANYRNNFALMIGHFYEVPHNFGEAFNKIGNPRLWTISLDMPIAKSEFPYAVLGSGSELARFCLNKLPFDKVKWELAMPMAVHIIEQVKGNDLFCDGMVKMGIIQMGRCMFQPEQLVNGFIKEIRGIQEKIDAKYREDLVGLIHTIATKYRTEIEKQLDEEEKQENQWREDAKKNNPLTVYSQKPIENKGEIK